MHGWHHRADRILQVHTPPSQCHLHVRFPKIIIWKISTSIPVPILPLPATFFLSSKSSSSNSPILPSYSPKAKELNDDRFMPPRRHHRCRPWRSRGRDWHQAGRPYCHALRAVRPVSPCTLSSPCHCSSLPTPFALPLTTHPPLPPPIRKLPP